MPAPINVPTPPPLATVRGVELMHAGTWDAKSGTHTFTADDFAAAVAALDCPAVRRPVLKFGHDGNHGVGMPALGWIENMATGDDGRVLIGDYVGMPAWLAASNADGQSVLSSAYPDRSIEGEWNFRCQIGHLHPFVVHAVALLGVERPGIGTLPSLQDLAALYGVAASSPEPSGTPVQVVMRASGQVQAQTAAKTGAMVALIPSDADTARLAVDGGEPAGELHVTLFYLGKGADFDADTRADLTESVRAAVAGIPPVDAEAFSVAVFNPADDERETAIVLGVGGASLDPIHDAVVAAVGDLSADLPAQHEPWQPHITLTYTGDLSEVAQYADRTGPVLFDRVRVAFAGEHTDIPLTATDQPATATAGERSTMPSPRPMTIAAGVSVEDVRRAYYDDAPWSYWITEVQLSPLQLIVFDDESGKRYRVPVDVTGEDDFTFGDPVRVVVRYEDAPAEPAAASTAATDGRVVFASRAESRPGLPPQASTEVDAPTSTEPANPPNDEPPAAEPESTTEPKEDPVSTSLSDLRSRLGLPDDADEAAITAATLAALDKQDTDPEPAPAAASTPAVPDGAVIVDRETLADLRRNAELGAAAHERQRVAERDTAIEAAVNDGKIPPARREHWVKAWEADAEGTRATLASLEPGLVVPVQAKGHTGPPEPAGDLDAEWAAVSHVFPPTETATKGA